MVLCCDSHDTPGNGGDTWGISLWPDHEAIHMLPLREETNVETRDHFSRVCVCVCVCVFPSHFILMSKIILLHLLSSQSHVNYVWHETALSSNGILVTSPTPSKLYSPCPLLGFQSARILQVKNIWRKITGGMKLTLLLLVSPTWVLLQSHMLSLFVLCRATMPQGTLGTGCTSSPSSSSAPFLCWTLCWVCCLGKSATSLSIILFLMDKLLSWFQWVYR